MFSGGGSKLNDLAGAVVPKNPHKDDSNVPVTTTCYNIRDNDKTGKYLYTGFQFKFCK
jgi:hypothetical protein